MNGRPMESLGGLQPQPEQEQEPSPTEEVAMEGGLHMLMGALGVPPVLQHGVEFGHHASKALDQGPGADAAPVANPDALRPDDAIRPGPALRMSMR